MFGVLGSLFAAAWEHWFITIPAFLLLATPAAPEPQGLPSTVHPDPTGDGYGCR